MKEIILLFQFDTERQQKLTRSLLPLKIRVKAVKLEELHLPIGYLAGNKDILSETETDAGNKELLPETESDTDMKKPDLKELDSEMIVMAGLSSTGIDAVLQVIRKSGIGPVPYKAILTPTNQHWDAAALLAELKREHELMSRK